MAIATTTSQRFSGRRPVAPRRKMGTWKMAYADFLTALVAFFLVMWLVSGVSPDSRTMIADFFTGEDTVGTESSTLVDLRPSETARAFHKLTSNPVLAAASTSLQLTQEAQGVRIDLVDSEARPLFASENGELTDAGAALTRDLGAALSVMAGPVTIEGHTDAFPSAIPNRSNWDISSERANAARRVLVDSGVSPERVRAVTGLAATQPLNPGEPHLSANRRISILIHLDG